MHRKATIYRLGDDAAIVRFSTGNGSHERTSGSIEESTSLVSWEVANYARAMSERIRVLNIESVTDVVPAYTTIAVYFESTRIAFDAIVAKIAPMLSGNVFAHADDSRLVEIRVRYNGPDLSEVANRTGLSVAEVITVHSSRTYRAYMSGFAPGFTYLGDLDPRLVVERRAAPRVRVPAGSVAIADAQTAVYPLETPGGWHLLGLTTAKMFDADRNPPALLRAGDRVRFIPVGE